MKLALRSALPALVLSALLVGGAAAVAQEKYPVDTVTIFTHSKPGSGSDLFLRAISQPLSKYLGANVVVD